MKSRVAMRFTAMSLLVIITAACNTRVDHPRGVAPVAIEDQVAAGRDYSLGYCSVALNAPAPCVEVRGKQASGVAPGCEHDNCTTAKQNARANLLTGIPAACGAYIQCNDPCRCIQKNAAGDLIESGPGTVQ
jgi:hypothetical protein